MQKTDELDGDVEGTYSKESFSHPTKGKKKRLVIRFNKSNAMYYAAFEGGGEIPKFCGGFWTDVPRLQQRVDTYNHSRDE